VRDIFAEASGVVYLRLLTAAFMQDNPMEDLQ